MLLWKILNENVKKLLTNLEELECGRNNTFSVLAHHIPNNRYFVNLLMTRDWEYYLEIQRKSICMFSSTVKIETQTDNEKLGAMRHFHFTFFTIAVPREVFAQNDVILTIRAIFLLNGEAAPMIHKRSKLNTFHAPLREYIWPLNHLYNAVMNAQSINLLKGTQ